MFVQSFVPIGHPRRRVHYVLNSKTGIFPVSKQYFCLGHFLSLSHTSCSDLVITSHRIISCFIFKVNFLLCLVSVLLSCFHLLMGFTCTLLPSCQSFSSQPSVDKCPVPRFVLVTSFVNTLCSIAEFQVLFFLSFYILIFIEYLIFIY